MWMVMDMATGKLEDKTVPEFGAFEYEVLNAEWLRPAVEPGLQPVVHYDRAPAESEADLFLRTIYACQE